MSPLLFNKKIEPSCSYCENGIRIGETEVACKKRGIVMSSGSCRKFKYDPLKREPPQHISLNTDGFSDEDFII